MKEKEIREGLNRLLSERENPDKVEGVLNRLIGEQGTPVENKSIPDRLWVLRERIKGLRSEAEDLSSLLEYHSGSRLSRVIDLLNQAEDLTEEAGLLTTGQISKFQISESVYDNSWEIWDGSVGVGIRFKKWDGKPQKSKILTIQTARCKTNPDREFVNSCVQDLISFAREKFPREFGTEVH